MMHSFLLIGQSNMAGRGFLSEAVPTNTANIYILRNGRWQSMFRPINPDRSFSGTNLAERFAECYVQTHGVDVGLICCADGGTTLEQWMPGSLLYDHALASARLAQRTSILAGILWHQGESDCTSARYPLYREKLLEMLRTLRRDLGLDDIPILLGGLGDYLPNCPRPDWEFHNYTYINKALKDITEILPQTTFVSAQGLTPNPDQLHFSASSLYEFGQRYFAAYEQLCCGSTPYRSQEVVSDLSRSEMEFL